MKLNLDLLDFINRSPVAYNAIENVEKELFKKDFIKLNENKEFFLEKGKNYFITRNGTSLIAFKIGKNVDSNYRYNIVASHSDSPCFKLKPNFSSKTDVYNKVNLEPYGGMICSTWLDRPLSLAGRVVYKNEGVIKSKVIDLDRDLFLIPNVCIHFNRTINDGYKYDMSQDMQAFCGQDLSEDYIKELISDAVGCEKDNIINGDLYLYNHQKAITFGGNDEYVLGPRLDDLECVYTSLKGFEDGENSEIINVFAVFDNEEVGSLTRQGADSNFLESVIMRINKALSFSDEQLNCALASSFMISADNAHATHPNKPQLSDSAHSVYMNNGIAIKFNAAQSYASDALSSSIVVSLCERAKVPYQYFANRSDIRGGSTLGNIVLNHISIMTCDVGLPQLAMHSCYECAGAKDIETAYQVFKLFYSTTIDINEGEIVLK